MKRYIHSSEAYNYIRFIIQYDEDGWCVYYQGKRVAGPFQAWINAEEYIDENLED